jgi:hypothetical protein
VITRPSKTRAARALAPFTRRQPSRVTVAATVAAVVFAVAAIIMLLVRMG